MFRTLAPFFIISVFILSLLPSNSYSSNAFMIEDCDELIALTGKDKHKMLCWYEMDNTKSTFTYAAKMYQNGKLTPIEDGTYVTRGYKRIFRTEQGFLLFHKNRAFLEKETQDSPDLYADFYEASFEGLERVYICYYDNEQKRNICAPSQDRQYTTRAKVTFETKDGFLPAGCNYDPHWHGAGKAALVCEDRN